MGEFTTSADQCGWGTCLWLGEEDGFASGLCVKDGDGNTQDDCAAFTGSGERRACQVDNSPPRTRIIPAGVTTVTLDHPTVTFSGDDHFHEQSTQDNKMGILGYCVESALPSTPSACTEFMEVAYPGQLDLETITVNILNSSSLQKEVNGQTYRVKFYSQDKYNNQENVQEAFVFIDNVPPRFEIGEEINTVADKTTLTVYLDQANEPMECNFALQQRLPLGGTQTKFSDREERTKEVVFSDLPGVMYNLTVICADDRGNKNTQSKSYLFDLEQRIDIVYPEFHGQVAESLIRFQVHTITGAQCQLFKSFTNEQVADFQSDEDGKEHRTPPIPGLIEKEYAGDYKVVCQELLAPDIYEDYFDFTVDFTAPQTQIVLREGQREERPRGFGWTEYFVDQAFVDFECNTEGFDCQDTFYCTGENCDNIQSPNYQEYSSTIALSDSTPICYYSTDTANNPVYSPECGEIRIEGYGITLEQPVQHYYQQEQWGVSNTPQFTWQFFTRVPTEECRYDFVSGFAYQTIPGFKVLVPNAQGRYVVDDFPSNTGSSSYPAQGGVKVVYVQCKNYAGELGPEQKINLEYDPDAPEITVAQAQPNPVLEGNQVDLFVETDDKTICKYSDQGHQEYALMNYAFPGGAADLVGTTTDLPLLLQPDHTTPYFINSFTGLVQEFSLTTMCRNGAYEYSELRTIPFTVDYTQVGGITAVWPQGQYLAVKNITLMAETSKNALCRYKADSAYVQLDGSGGTSHFKTISGLKEGYYQYPLRCQIGDHLAENIFTFTIDFTAPSISRIDDGEYTCGNNISAMIYTHELNLSTIQYEVYDVGESLNRSRNASARELVLNASVPAHLPIQIPALTLSENHRYVVKARAQDGAGNWGSFIESDGTIVVEKNYSVCAEDQETPAIDIVANASCTATVVELQCEDTTGCSTIRYGTSAVANSCQAQEAYAGQKLSFDTTGWVCYYLEDTVGNNQTGNRMISFADADGDGIADRCDQCADSDPGKIVDGEGCAEGQVPAGERSLDSDNDGLPDYWEKVYSSLDCELNYLAADTDMDGTADTFEDQDADTYTNYEEYTQNFNPCLADAAPAEQPPGTGITPTIITPDGENNTVAWILLLLGIGLVAGGTGYLIYYYKYSPAGRTGKRTSPRTTTFSPLSVAKPTFLASWKQKLSVVQRFRNQKSKQRQREAVFGTFAQDSTAIPHIDEILQKKTAPAPKLQELAQHYQDHKDEIKPGLRPEEKSIFSQLETIAASKKASPTISKEDALDLFTKLKELSKRRRAGR